MGPECQWGKGSARWLDAGDHDAVLGGGDRAAGDFAGVGGKGLDEPVQPDLGIGVAGLGAGQRIAGRPAPQYVSPSGEVM